MLLDFEIKETWSVIKYIFKKNCLPDLIFDAKHFIFNRTCEPVTKFLETGQYEGATLKGSTPPMVYADTILQGFCEAITERFQTETKNVLNASKILNFS